MSLDSIIIRLITLEPVLLGVVVEIAREANATAIFCLLTAIFVLICFLLVFEFVQQHFAVARDRCFGWQAQLVLDKLANLLSQGYLRN